MTTLLLELLLDEAMDSTDAAHFLDQGRPQGIRKFPAAAQSICLTALTVAAEGGKADIPKPLRV